MTRKLTLILMALIALTGLRCWAQSDIITVDMEREHSNPISGMPMGWTVLDNDGDGLTWQFDGQGNAHGGNGAVCSYRRKPTEIPSFVDDFLISPQFDLGKHATISFWAKTVGDDRELMEVRVSTTGTEASNFQTVDELRIATQYGGYRKYTIDLSEYPDQKVYIAICHSNHYIQYGDCPRVYLDDISIFLGRTAPLTVDFEDGELPENWSVIDADQDNINWQITNENAHDESLYALESHKGWPEQANFDVDNFLVSPQLDLGRNAKLEFYALAYPGESFGVAVSTTETVFSDFTMVKQWLVDNETYSKYEVDLSEYAGQKVYLAIRHITSYSAIEDMGQKVYLDDITIDFGDYEQNGHNVFITQPTVGGQISATPHLYVPQSTYVNLDAFPEFGYGLDQWIIEPAVSLEQGGFSMPNRDVTVTATFKTLDMYYISFVLYDSEKISVKATYNGETILKAPAGTVVTLEHTMLDEGYRLKYWTVDGLAIDGNTFSMPAGNVEVRPIIGLIESVTVNLHSNGVVTQHTLTYGQPFPDCDNIPQGLSFCGWTATDIETYTEDTPTFITEVSDITDVYAVFKYVENSKTYYMTEVITGGKIASASTKNIIINGNRNAIVTGRLELVAGGLFRNDMATNLEFADGAQFYYTGSATISAQFDKDITGYSGTRDNYYLVANPTANTGVMNLASNSYDLYTFDPAEPLEWRNQHNNTTMDRGTGYLYANSDDVTLEFAGILTPAGSSNIELTYANAGEGIDFPGFNLIGNPYPCNAYVNGYNFYKMTNGELQAAITTIAPCEGFFVEATSEGQSVGLTTNQTRASASVLNIEVSQNQGEVIDRALVRFDGINDMHKFMLNSEHTNLSIAKNGEEFAAVSTDATHGEIPVNFKAEKDGKYAISVEVGNVDVEYLHLVDNQTGADVDLLGCGGDVACNVSTYTFEAKANDYASRFKLVFSVKADAASTSSASNFAYISNGNLVIDNIEGQATLQIIDELGRVVSTETVSGSYNKSLNLKAGLYILNLNGMTQKIVVE